MQAPLTSEEIIKQRKKIGMNRQRLVRIVDLSYVYLMITALWCVVSHINALSDQLILLSLTMGSVNLVWFKLFGKCSSWGYVLAGLGGCATSMCTGHTTDGNVILSALASAGFGSLVCVSMLVINKQHLMLNQAENGLKECKDWNIKEAEKFLRCEEIKDFCQCVVREGRPFLEREIKHMRRHVLDSK